MKILFPTDFSENSEVALKYAIDFAQKINGNITLINVYKVKNIEYASLGILSDLGNKPSSRLQEKVETDIKEEIEMKLIKLATDHGLEKDQFDFYALEGNVKAEIDQMLKDEKFDLVVLGTKGENSQRGVFFGGIANHLIQTAYCPVIAVPFYAKYQEVKRIMYPTDLAHEEKNNLNWLINYAKLYDANLHLVHIENESREEEDEIELKYQAMNLVYDKLTYELISGDDIADLIVEVSRDKDIDVISMTTHTTTLFKKVFHASFTQEVLDRVGIPFIGFSQKNTEPYLFE